MVANDEMSDEEAGFMKGYDEASESETVEDEEEDII